MKLEEQVCSLSLSQRLKELGVKQDSLYFYERHIDGSGDHTIWSPKSINNADRDRYISAFTVAELGEMLPERYATFRHNDEYTCELFTLDEGEKLAGYANRFQTAKTEADARAKMLIYLIEQGLVKV